MHKYSLIYPMLAMVLLTFSVFVRLFLTRLKSVKAGTTKFSYFEIYQGKAEPDSAIKLARHFANLFETPVLFYVACLAAMTTNATGLPFLVLAWLYVVARMVHAYIHTGDNHLMSRIRVYFLSWAVLLAMWILLSVRVAILN